MSRRAAASSASAAGLGGTPHGRASLAFLQHLVDCAGSTADVLDLGAGRGDQARFFAAAGARVVAVEREARTIENVEWQCQSLEQWCATARTPRFDVVLLRHLLQQLDREWALAELLPAVARVVRPGGLVGIETFRAPPAPIWEGRAPTTFRATEICQAFPGWEAPIADEPLEDGLDASGVPRRFYVTRVVLRAPTSVRVGV